MLDVPAGLGPHADPGAVFARVCPCLPGQRKEAAAPAHAGKLSAKMGLNPAASRRTRYAGLETSRSSDETHL